MTVMMRAPLRAEAAELLEEADDLLAIMLSESLPLVEEHARALCHSAMNVRAFEIASAARELEHVSAGRNGPVSLTPAMRRLTEAITKMRHER